MTEEQLGIVKIMTLPDSTGEIVGVNAVAGSGKTTTAQEVIRALQPTNGFYTAFNKAIIEDSKSKFGDKVECKTLHALAYKYVRPKRPLEELSYTTITEDHIDYEDKAVIIKTLDEFYRSAYINIYDFLEDSDLIDNEELEELVVKYAEAMLNNQIPQSFNYLLKCFHIMLVNNEINVDFDLFILDECQDTTAVALEIFKVIKSKKKIMLGDEFQNIYSFMNTVNGFEIIEDAITLSLTQSFRCSTEIADRVDFFGKKFLTKSFKFTGNSDIIDTDIKTVSYISRTNAAIISRINSLHHTNTPYSLTRDLKEIFALPLALVNAASNKPVYDRRYRYLEKEYNEYRRSFTNVSNVTTFYSFLNEKIKDEQLQSSINLLMMFNKKGINIFDVLSKAKQVKPDNTTIVTTSHAFKGLETDEVYIEDCLNNTITLALKKGEHNYTKEDKENFNVYYVAITRAKKILNNAYYTRLNDLEQHTLTETEEAVVPIYGGF